MPEIIEVDTAIKSIPLGGRILIGSGAAVPAALMEGLSRHSNRFHDIGYTM